MGLGFKVRVRVLSSGWGYGLAFKVGVLGSGWGFGLGLGFWDGVRVLGWCLRFRVIVLGKV